MGSNPRWGLTIDQSPLTKMDVTEVFFQVPSEDIAYVQAIFESYEGVGFVRTVDPHRATIALLVVEDARATARGIIDSLKKDIALTEISRPDDIGEDWLLQELSTEDSVKE